MDQTVTGFWRRLDTPGRDAAQARPTVNGYELLGQSVFLDPRGPTALRYVLDLDEAWTTRTGHITGFIGTEVIDTSIARTPDGWTLNGRDQGMHDVLDLDLGFTPATNMAQLRRIDLAIGDTASFDVAWLEAGDHELTRLPQQYTRTSELAYAYRSPSADYSATIALEPTGFAADYPTLWEHDS